MFQRIDFGYCVVKGLAINISSNEQDWNSIIASIDQD